MDKPTINGNRMTIPSDLNYLAAVDEFVEGKIRSFGVADSDIADIAISVSELINNAVTHGNKSDRSKQVEIEVGRADGSVVISVTDQGGGFNPDKIDDPRKKENLLKEAGRGMFIVESLMDKVDISLTTDGTRITITKSLH